jgi:hypothetical protein
VSKVNVYKPLKWFGGSITKNALVVKEHLNLRTNETIKMVSLPGGLLIAKALETIEMVFEL